jgi:translation initiation factor 1
LPKTVLRTVLAMTVLKRLKSLEDLKELFPDAGKGVPERARTSAHTVTDGRGRQVRVRLETGGRKGKSVTVVSGLGHDPQTMERIARVLKQLCGAGGTVKEGTIEVQGDQRERVGAYLKESGYAVR